MQPFILAIAGGTGSGKSTLADGLSKIYSEETLVIHLDDYLRPPPELPTLKGHLNWDHPDAVNSPQLGADLSSLKNGNDSEITRKDPDAKRPFKVYGARKRVKVRPQKLIILEGFLALYYPELRKLYDYSIYLDAPFDTHIGRRVHFINDDYRDEVIKHMHKQYVETSKQYADQVIDAMANSSQAVLAAAQSALKSRLA